MEYSVIKRLLTSIATVVFFHLTGLSQTIEFNHKGNNRTCTIHLPSSYNPINSYPLVFNLHGSGSNSFQQQLFSGMDAIADTGGFIVAYPQAVSDQWDIVFSNSPIDDIGFFNILLDSLIGRYNVDPSLVYATGMSMGGYMSYRLGCEMSNRLAAIASVAGPIIDSVIFDCNNSRVIPIMHIHGTEDDVIPYSGGIFTNPLDSAMLFVYHIDSMIQYFANKNGCSIPVVHNYPDTNIADSSTVTSYYYCMGEESAEVLLYKVHRGGHSWPGSVIPFNVTNYDINASDEIWKFFRKHQLINDTTGILNSNPNESLCIFPNPANERLQIKLPMSISTGTTLIQLFDMTGKVHKSLSVSGVQDVRLDLPDLQAGIYLIRAVTEKITYQSLVIRSE